METNHQDTFEQEVPQEPEEKIVNAASEETVTEETPVVENTDTQETVEAAKTSEAVSGTAEAAPENNAQEAPQQTARSPYADSPYQTYQNPYQSQPYTTYVPPKKPKKAKKAKSGAGRKAVAAVLAVTLVGGSCGITAAAMNHYWENRVDSLTTSFNQRLDVLQSQIKSSGNSVSGSPVASTEGMTPSQIYAQNVNSVVAITNTGISTNNYGQTGTSVSSGSGFIYTSDGYIVTNYHVVKDAQNLTVTTYDGTSYDATFVGGDENNDIAVIKVNATDLPAAAIGSSSDLIVGDQVVAIGNPLGELTSTQTVGYVSGMNRDVSTDGSVINMIQTDAAINPGNSGGPLFNMYGQVVGITTAKYSGTTSSGASIEGIGFAIPIDDVKGMVDDLIQYGYITGAYLGVMVQNMDESVTNYGLPQGAYVKEVTPGYCAEAGGMQAGDIITDLGGYSVSSITDLTRALRHFKAGDSVVVTVYRSGKIVQLTLVLSEKPQTTDTTDENTDSTDPSMPSEGNYDDWYEFFRRYFGSQGGTQNGGQNGSGNPFGNGGNG